MVYDKCMRLAPWSSTDSDDDEESRLLHDTEDDSSTRSGLITNLVSQDTYNVMSCVWICHYIWAIPLKASQCQIDFFNTVCYFVISYFISLRVTGNRYIVFVVYKTGN